MSVAERRLTGESWTAWLTVGKLWPRIGGFHFKSLLIMTSKKADWGCLKIHIAINGQNRYHLFILTIDFSKNFTTMQLLTIGHTMVLWWNLFKFNIMVKLGIYQLNTSLNIVFLLLDLPLMFEWNFHVRQIYTYFMLIVFNCFLTSYLMVKTSGHPGYRPPYLWWSFIVTIMQVWPVNQL